MELDRSGSDDDGSDPLPPWNEADELARIRGGDEAAARRAIDWFYPVVIRIVRSHRPRSDDEEDIAQEVFMKIFTRIDQFSGRQPFEHWVSRIALNTCYDRLRRQRNQRVISYSDLSIEDADRIEALAMPAGVDGSGSVPDDLAGEDARELLARLLGTLKPREQVVIRLLDLEERSVREAADLTGWGHSKIKVTAFRARKKLAASLEKLESARGRRTEPESLS